MIPRKARPGVERERYVCRGRIERGPDFCDQPSIRRELVDEPFLRTLLDNYIDMAETKRRVERTATRTLDAAREALVDAHAEVLHKQESLARVERDYLDGKLQVEKWDRFEAKLLEEQQAAQAALERAQAHVQEVEASGPVGYAEEALLRLLAMIKRAVAEGIERAPNLDALRNVIAQMFESVELIQHPSFGTSTGRDGSVIPNVNGPDPLVNDGDVTYWLLPKLALSAVDSETFKPTGQAIPVPEWQSYPHGFLCRYCWW